MAAILLPIILINLNCTIGEDFHHFLLLRKITSVGGTFRSTSSAYRNNTIPIIPIIDKPTVKSLMDEADTYQHMVLVRPYNQTNKQRSLLCDNKANAHHQDLWETWYDYRN